MSLLIAVATCAAWIMQGTSGSAALAIAATSLAMLCYASFGFVVNDILDLPKDRLNRPSAPLVKGTVSVRFALALALALVAIGLTLSSFAGTAFVLVSLAIVLALALYSPVLRRHGYLANATTAVLCSIPMLIPSICSNTMLRGDAMAIAILTFIFISGREIVKDLVDVAGDRAIGVRTLPVIYGERVARYAAVGFVAGCVPAALLILMASPESWPLLAVCAAAAIVLVALVVRRHDRAYLHGSQAALVVMVIMAVLG